MRFLVLFLFLIKTKNKKTVLIPLPLIVCTPSFFCKFGHYQWQVFGICHRSIVRFMGAMRMEWSAASATNAYFDTIKLCNDRRKQCDSVKLTQEPGSNEFVSALAAGMKAKLIVEVTSSVSPSTIALAAAAKHTGGRLVCILPEAVLAESKKVIKDSGLKDLVEFKTGDPSELLTNYQNIDFSLVDCKNDECAGLLKMLDVNPRKSVVVTTNLVGERKGFEGYVKKGAVKEERVVVRSVKHPIGKVMEVTMIGKEDWGGGRVSNGVETRGGYKKWNGNKSKWLVKVDEKSGEEHIFRISG